MRVFFLLCILMSYAWSAYATPISFTGRGGTEDVAWMSGSEGYFAPRHSSVTPETFTLTDGQTKIFQLGWDSPTGDYATETDVDLFYALHLSGGLTESLEFSYSTMISSSPGYPYQGSVVASVSYGGNAPVVPLGQMVNDPGSPWGLSMYPDFRPASVDLTLSDGNILQFAYVYDMYSDDIIYDTFRVTNLGRQHAPEPGTVFLFGAGLAGLFFFSNRKQRNRLWG